MEKLKQAGNSHKPINCLCVLLILQEKKKQLSIKLNFNYAVWPYTFTI